MRKVLYIGFIFCYINLFGQSTEQKAKSNFGIEVSTEQRFSPIYLSGFAEIIENPKNLIFYSADDQIAGTSLGLGLYYHFKKINAEIKYVHSLKYDHIYYDSYLLEPNTELISNSIKGIISDHHLIFEKGFLIHTKTAIKLGVGYSLMNYGTEYALSTLIGKPSTGNIYGTSENNFHFTAFNISTGIDRNPFLFTLGGYFTDKHNFNQPSNLMVLYLKLGIKIGLFFKE
jgi:hypothetical protein